MTIVEQRKEDEKKNPVLAAAVMKAPVFTDQSQDREKES